MIIVELPMFRILLFLFFYIFNSFIIFFSFNLYCFVFTKILSNNLTENGNISSENKAVVIFFIQMKIELLILTFFNLNLHLNLLFLARYKLYFII